MFDGQNSYIEHKASGRKTKIYERDGTYAIDLWVSSDSETEAGTQLAAKTGSAGSGNSGSQHDAGDSFLRHV